MRHSRWISSILLLSLTSTQVVVADDRSLHDSSHLGDSISGYIEQYNQMMSSQIQPPAPGESAADWKKKWEASRAGQILKMVLDGDIERLSQNISSLGNNDTFADQHARLLVGLVRDVSRQNPETYDEAVSMLLADYYESPSRRDAIYELLAATSSQLKSTGAMAASDPNRYLTAAADGTMTAWTLLTLWNWRGGAKGLARDGKTIYSNLGRGLRWMSQSLKTRIRPGSASMNSMVAVQDWVGSTAAQLPILVSNARLGAQGQTIQKELAVIIEQQRAAETGKAAEKISKTYLQKLAIYMRT